MKETINILGYSENVLAMVLETIFIKYGDTFNINIIQNMPLDITDIEQFCPKGLGITIGLHSDFKDVKQHDVLLGTFTPIVKKSIVSFFLENYTIKKDQYKTLVHPTSHLASSTTLSSGVYIEPGSIVSPFAELGFANSINRNVSIGHHTQLEDYVTIAPGVNIGGNVKIGRGATIGIGATVFNEISIGENSIIGGGSVVTKDIPANVVAFGSPCKIVKSAVSSSLH